MGRGALLNRLVDILHQRSLDVCDAPCYVYAVYSIFLHSTEAGGVEICVNPASRLLPHTARLWGTQPDFGAPTVQPEVCLPRSQSNLS